MSKESGLYYLQSRYYDPEIGRFINADNYTSTGQGLLGFNMFAYCRNNPVCRKDASGTDDVRVTNDTTEDDNPLNDAGTSFRPGGAGGGGGNGSGSGSGSGGGSICYSPGASYYYGADFSASTNSSLVHGGIYNNGYTFYSGNAAAPAVCFVAGTLVQTEDGTIPIENISAGDRVWAWDEETGDVALKEVVETYINESSDLIHVFVNGEEIVTTPFHPFYSPVKGWTDAVKLRAGDVLVLVNGEYVVVERVQHEILESAVTVYNFQVEDYHTYYVADAGVLVHNACDKPTAPKEIGKRYIDSNDIDAHAFKQQAGGVPRSQISRYDIYQDTADNHTLWVGKKDGRDWRKTIYVFSDLIEKWVK